MNRLAVIAEDRDFTRFVAESLIGRSMEAFVPRPDDPWSIARAHTGVEALVLLGRSPSPFQLALIDHRLPDMSALELLRRLREEGHPGLEIVLMSERGRDRHFRTSAASRFDVAAFADRPVTREGLARCLDMVRRHRRLLITGDAASADWVLGLTDAGYHVEVRRSATDALAALEVFEPDLVLCTMHLPDASGAQLCADLKRAAGYELPVLLLGPVGAVPPLASSENVLRADDFIQTSAGLEDVLERVRAQVGPSRPVDLPAVYGTPPSARRQVPTNPRAGPLIAPPASASPQSEGDSKRLARRVPCSLSLTVRDRDQEIRSTTMDISRGGIFVSLSPQPPVGTVVDLEIDMPEEGARTVHAVGRVAWTTEQGVGLRFSEIDKRDLEAIVAYVNKVAQVVYFPAP